MEDGERPKVEEHINHRFGSGSSLSRGGAIDINLNRTEGAGDESQLVVDDLGVLMGSINVCIEAGPTKATVEAPSDRPSQLAVPLQTPQGWTVLDQRQ